MQTLPGRSWCNNRLRALSVPYRGRVTAHRHGWGTTRKLSSGRWQARFPDPDRPGQRKAAPQTFGTRSDADRWLARARTDLDRGVFANARAVSPITVDEYVATYLSRRPRLSPKTIESYGRGRALYISPTLGSQVLATVTPGVVSDWWADLLRTLPESGRGLTSRSRAYELLRAVFAEAVEHDLLASSPCRLRVAVKPSPRPHVTHEQVGTLVEGMPERWRAAVLLAATTGLRFGELAGLRQNAIDLPARRLTTKSQLLTLEDGTQVERAPKTAAGWRTIALPPHLVPILKAHLDAFGSADTEAYTFTDDDGRPLAHRRWNYRWDRARVAAGLPGVHFHDLRHAALTLLAQSGATLAELMSHAGHATPTAAIRYQRVAEGRGDVLAERLSAAWQGQQAR